MSINIRAFAIFAHWLPAVNIASEDKWVLLFNAKNLKYISTCVRDIT